MAYGDLTLSTAGRPNTDPTYRCRHLHHSRHRLDRSRQSVRLALDQPFLAAARAFGRHAVSGDRHLAGHHLPADRSGKMATHSRECGNLQRKLHRTLAAKAAFLRLCPLGIRPCLYLVRSADSGAVVDFSANQKTLIRALTGCFALNMKHPGEFHDCQSSLAANSGASFNNAALPSIARLCQPLPRETASCHAALNTALSP